MQVLEGANLKPLVEHMNGQQFRWLQAFVLGKPPEVRAAEAAPLADFLAGCSQQGYRYTPAFYGCLAPYLPVGLSFNESAINLVLGFISADAPLLAPGMLMCKPMIWQQLSHEAFVRVHDNVIGVQIALSVAGHDCRGAQASHSASNRAHYLPSRCCRGRGPVSCLSSPPLKESTSFA